MARTIKRLIDVSVAALGLIIFAPFMVVIALVLYLTQGPPILFRHVRPGYRERPFAVLKFRTMTNAASRDGTLLPDAERLTRVGRFLRKTSLDELPQLWNVLRGDMSLVGPRPLLVRYLPYYTDRERLRFSVRPGITGLAQLHGRNHTPWSERLELDAWYVENWSLWLDIEILVLTLINVIARKDVVVDTRSIMPDLDEERRNSAYGKRI